MPIGPSLNFQQQQRRHTKRNHLQQMFQQNLQGFLSTAKSPTIEYRFSESKSQIGGWIDPDFDTAFTYPTMTVRSRPAAAFICNCSAPQSD